MTKEECTKALSVLTVDRISHHKCEEKEVDEVVEAKFVLMDLIHKHFDNPPLKFEELHADMWLWDNENEEYLYLNHIGAEVLDLDDCLVVMKIGFPRFVIYDFEENRFYRRRGGEQ